MRFGYKPIEIIKISILFLESEFFRNSDFFDINLGRAAKNNVEFMLKN